MGGLTRVLMTLQHKLRLTRRRIPELHATVLATRHNPLTVRGERNTENKVLVALESLDALAALGLVTGAVVESRVIKLPHLDCLIQGAGDEVAAVGGEGECPDSGRMPWECLETVPILLRVVNVELYCVVVRRGGEDLRWWASERRA